MSLVRAIYSYLYLSRQLKFQLTAVRATLHYFRHGAGVGVAVGRPHLTVSVALSLVTLPARLVTVTAKREPLSSIVAGMVT